MITIRFSAGRVRRLSAVLLVTTSLQAAGSQDDASQITYGEACDKGSLNLRAWNDYERTEKAPDALGRQIIEFDSQDQTATAHRRTKFWDTRRTRTSSDQSKIPIEFMKVGRIWYPRSKPGSYDTTVVFKMNACEVEIVFPTMEIPRIAKD